MSRFAALYEESLTDPEAFWLRAAQAIEWTEAPSRALDDANPPFYQWFSDGRFNTCHNAVDRHVAAGHGERPAVIHDSPVTGAKETLTYADLLDRVSRLAGTLRERGVAKGDRVMVYMPMIPEALIAMLACSRIGAVHSVVFGGFAARELAVRLDDARPKAVLAASCGIEPGRVVAYKPLLDEAIRIAEHSPDFCLIRQRERQRAELTDGRDFDWFEAQEGAERAACVDVCGSDPLYILYTSGTTGRPKGVVRSAGGHAVALAWSMPSLYGIAPGDTFWTASDVGWVVGHSYIVYGPLLHGATTVMFEGKPVGTPDAGVFWRVIQEHRVRALFTAPTAFRAIRRADPKGERIREHDLSSLRSLFLAGERADPDTLAWARAQLGVPVIDHWWQTETGWAISANPVGTELLPIKPGSPGVPMPGYVLEVLSADGGQPLPPGEFGSIGLKLPLPPGCLPTLWNADDRYRQSYLSRFPGYYETGDAGFKDEDGYVFVMSRTDDVINVAGHRLSTGAIEEAIATHPDVAECAVVGVRDSLKGQLPLALLCLNAGCDRPEGDIRKECVAKVREHVGPVAAFSLAAVVERLPKTRSGKILRGTVAKIADGDPWSMPATIDDPAILDEIAAALAGLGYPLGNS